MTDGVGAIGGVLAAGVPVIAGLAVANYTVDMLNQTKKTALRHPEMRRLQHSTSNPFKNSTQQRINYMLGR